MRYINNLQTKVYITHQKMKYERVLWFTFAATLCFSFWAETALLWSALQSLTL